MADGVEGGVDGILDVFDCEGDGSFSCVGDFDCGVEEDGADLVAEGDEEFGLDGGDFLVKGGKIFAKDVVWEGTSVCLCGFGEIRDVEILARDDVVNVLGEFRCPVDAAHGLNGVEAVLGEKAEFKKEFPNIFCSDPWRPKPCPRWICCDILARGIHEDKTDIGIVDASCAVDRIQCWIAELFL